MSSFISSLSKNTGKSSRADGASGAGATAARDKGRKPSSPKSRMARFMFPLPGKIRKVHSKAKKSFSPTPTDSRSRAKVPATADLSSSSASSAASLGRAVGERESDGRLGGTTASASAGAAPDIYLNDDLDDPFQHASVTGRRGCPVVHWSNAVLRTGIDAECPTPEPIAEDVCVLRKFEAILSSPNVNLNNLRTLAWNGVPTVARPLVWQLLLGYLPSNTSRREVMLARRRREYATCIPQYWDVDECQRTSAEEKVLRQILVDIPRTHPDIPLFHTSCVQRALERILYIWAIKHPASGYVQGMNDLVTPFYLVFLGAFVDNPRSCDASQIPSAVLSAVEADSYWCLTKLLDGIQDHYTPSQPGVQRMVHRLELLTKRIDVDLHAHLQNEGIMFMQFAFRWMNCLLMRELTLRSVVRLWDTYLSEANHGFDVFHVYVCASFLHMLAPKIKSMAFQELVSLCYCAIRLP